MQDSSSAKLALVKKALIEERKKSQNEITKLQDIILEKEAIISQLRNLLDNEPEAKSNPLTHKENLLLLEEISQLKEENSMYQDQNMFLKNQLENLSTELDTLRTSYEKQINDLQLVIDEKNNLLTNNSTKVNVIEHLYKDYEKGKSFYESQIVTLQKEKNELFTQLNEANIQIEKLQKENDDLKIELEKNIVIDKSYIFQGRIKKFNNNDVDGDITLNFGKFEDIIELTILTHEKFLNVKHINKITKLNGKEFLLDFNEEKDDSDSNKKSDDLQRSKMIVALPKEKELEYLLKFYNEMKETYEKQTNKFWLLSFGNYFPQ